MGKALWLTQTLVVGAVNPEATRGLQPEVDAIHYTHTHTKMSKVLMKESAERVRKVSVFLKLRYELPIDTHSSMWLDGMICGRPN